MALKRIQDESAKVMDREVTKEEIQEIMQDLPLRKQAGPNRIPNGLYRTQNTIQRFCPPPSRHTQRSDERRHRTPPRYARRRHHSTIQEKRQGGPEKL